MSTRKYKTDFRKYCRKFSVGVRIVEVESQHHKLEFYKLSLPELQKYYADLQEVTSSHLFYKLGELGITLPKGTTIWTPKSKPTLKNSESDMSAPSANDQKI